ncbi:PREDICTED: protein phosphatase 1 regulatory subunit 12B-like isoform X2 [Cyprinodon variegatus]|uniref:protein phosphatase 1 regulatory subunit 12B-like isoform X2 n=1 Tax=Cyprinodon variegatus TaxID=28743 RepID=UPI000742B18D|nr:PREDICTED: protein phosphatase 1 regulatory subunit 12B-like isoform X2 [Cyprinodon variegatus]
MQAFVSRSYLAPVKDEEAESQRKAKSRHARQTRRSTQGVTLTELKEAQMSYSLSYQDRENKEENPQGNRLCLRRGFADDSGDQSGLLESKETSEATLSWRQIDKEGNINNGLESVAESPNLTNLSASGLYALPQTYSFFEVGERRWNDENQNPFEDAPQVSYTTKIRQRYHVSDADGMEHERLLRYDSTGENATDKPLGRTSSYTRREARLAALNKQEEDSTAKDYKKMYTEALQENERLKSKLQDSKQELVKIRSQLEKVAQRQDRLSERSTVLETEKREKQALEKRVTDMEDEVKVLKELKSDNQRLKDENGALIRVISKLSK